MASSRVTTPAHIRPSRSTSRSWNSSKNATLFLMHLLIEGLQDHVPRAVGGVAGPADGGLAEVPRVAAETSLIDPPVLGAVKGQAAILKFVDRPHRVLSEDRRRLLIDEVVAAFDRIEGMPLGLIRLHIA